VLLTPWAREPPRCITNITSITAFFSVFHVIRCLAPILSSFPWLGDTIWIQNNLFESGFKSASQINLSKRAFLLVQNKVVYDNLLTILIFVLVKK
jgi:hypothetical protein